MGWEPIFEYRTDVWLGIVDRELFVRTRGGELKPVGANGGVGLLPLLEFGYDDVAAAMRERERALDWPEGELLAFVSPVSLLRTAIDMKSVYWTRLALGWVESLPMTMQVSDVLADLRGQGWTTQEIRHRSKRCLSSGYSSAGVKPTSWGRIRRRDDGRWETVWDLRLRQAPAVEEVVVHRNDAIGFAATLVVSGDRSELRVITGAPAMAAEYYSPTFVSFGVVNDSIGEIVTIEGLPRDWYSPFRDRSRGGLSGG